MKNLIREIKKKEKIKLLYSNKKKNLILFNDLITIIFWIQNKLIKRY